MEILNLIFSSFWHFIGFSIICSILVKGLLLAIAMITKTPLYDGYSKQDLSDAWHHGAIRAPKEFQHLNNFDEYFKHKHKHKS